MTDRAATLATDAYHTSPPGRLHSLIDPDHTLAGVFACAGRTEVTAVHVSVTVLGWELLNIEVGATATEYDSPGDCTTYPIGFIARHEMPDEAAGLVDRRPWDD